MWDRILHVGCAFNSMLVNLDAVVNIICRKTNNRKTKELNQTKQIVNNTKTKAPNKKRNSIAHSIRNTNEKFEHKIWHVLKFKIPNGIQKQVWIFLSLFAIFCVLLFTFLSIYPIFFQLCILHWAVSERRKTDLCSRIEHICIAQGKEENNALAVELNQKSINPRIYIH